MFDPEFYPTPAGLVCDLIAPYRKDALFGYKARRLLKNAWDHSTTFACGGFWAYFSDGVLSLHFTIETFGGDE